MMRYECYEAGCAWTTEVETEQELLDAVNRHMTEAHDSFELEDVIIDNAVAVTEKKPERAKG